jgi:hypothetical protein
VLLDHASLTLTLTTIDHTRIHLSHLSVLLTAVLNTLVSLVVIVLRRAGSLVRLIFDRQLGDGQTSRDQSVHQASHRREVPTHVLLHLCVLDISRAGVDLAQGDSLQGTLREDEGAVHGLVREDLSDSGRRPTATGRGSFLAHQLVIVQVAVSHVLLALLACDGAS